jgi:hypothetical protein
MPSLYQQRSQFEKQLLAAIGPALRGTLWKKSGNLIFARVGDSFVALSLSVHRNDERTSAALSVKPMALDPILWDILGIEGNQDLPLSFRALGAFTCAALPILECNLEQPGQTPDQVAAAILQLLESSSKLHEIRTGSARFSELVAAHPSQVLRGAYAITLVTGLIHEGSEMDALELARAYATGAKSSCAQMTSMGASFHDLAVRWIESGRSARRAINAAV